MMKAWKANDNVDFDFNNAHDLNSIDPDSSEETIKKHLRARMANSKVLVILVGKNTKYLRKYVRWEIEIALESDLAIIAVNLNKKTVMDWDLCPAIVRDELALHIPYGLEIMQRALDEWPEFCRRVSARVISGNHFYIDRVYQEIESERLLREAEADRRFRELVRRWKSKKIATECSLRL